MAKKKWQRPKTQSVDHNNNFRMLPKRVTTSVAWRKSSFRMRSVVIAFLNAFDGQNNGHIEFSIKALGQAIGSQSHAYNAKAVAEAIELGFIECTSDANRAHAKARTYRLTFVSTFRNAGDDVQTVPATHEYDDWRPVKKRKFGGGRTTTTDPEKTTVTTTTVKKPVAVTTTCSTENCGFEADTVVGDTTTHLYTRVLGSEAVSNQSEKLSDVSSQPSGEIYADLDVLRSWAKECIQESGYGANQRLAKEAGLTSTQMTRFKAGKRIPNEARGALQIACSRIIPFNQRKDNQSAALDPSSQSGMVAPDPPSSFNGGGS
ncbi:MAG: hypothetical protein AAGK17_13485 [Pseudomonadota bacterium]